MAAQIKVNGVVGSNVDLPINTLVLLDNANTGGETTFAWTILDQPPGTADALSSAGVQAPTFTPKKEGTYLIRLVVNAGLVTEATDTKVVAVRQLKTRERVPAAGESIEADTADGWAVDVDAFLRHLDSFMADPGTIVGQASAGLARGDVLYPSGVATIKSGLPGQEVVLTFAKAPATLPAATLAQLPLFVLEGGVDGSTTPANGALIKVRFRGMFGPVSATTGTLYVSDTATLSASPGTNRRSVGYATATGGSVYVVIDPGQRFAEDADKAALDVLTARYNYTGTVVTTDATPTTAKSLSPADGHTWHVTARVAAYAAASVEGAGYLLSATFRRASGTTTQVGTTTALATHEDVGAWAATLDTDGSSIRVRVTGEAAKAITWVTDLAVTIA